MKLVSILSLAILAAALVGCGPKEEVLDASPTSSQAPKTPKATVNKPGPTSFSASDQAGAAGPSTP